MKMWQPQLQVGVVAMIMLLHIEYSLVMCTTMTHTYGPRARYRTLQIMAVISTNYSVYESDNLSDWQKDEDILPGIHLAVKEMNTRRYRHPMLHHHFRHKRVNVGMSLSTTLNCFGAGFCYCHPHFTYAFLGQVFLFYFTYLHCTLFQEMLK